jgi:hypothetical protein
MTFALNHMNSLLYSIRLHAFCIEPHGVSKKCDFDFITHIDFLVFNEIKVKYEVQELTSRSFKNGRRNEE